MVRSLIHYTVITPNNIYNYILNNFVTFLSYFLNKTKVLLRKSKL